MKNKFIKGWTGITMSALMLISTFTDANADGIASRASSFNPDEFVVIHCESPGTLRLTEESLYAPCLKITGDIDARDFQTLKTVTINVTRTLDLSETSIHAYKGKDGCAAADLSPDWIIGGSSGPMEYQADMLPVHSFTETRDNSLSKYRRGSESLSKLILPSSLKGFMREALQHDNLLTDIEVSDNAENMSVAGGLVYDKSKSTLLMVPPATYGDISVAKTVTNVAFGAFSYASPASVTFEANKLPAFEEENNIAAAYIICADTEGCKNLYPDVDCIDSMTIADIKDVAPGQLMASIGNMGYTRTSLRGVKVSGELSYDDLTQLLDLPNLHVADLSQAFIKFEGDRNLTISNSALTELFFPEFKGFLALTIADECRLNGHLDVPEGTYWFHSGSVKFSSVNFPSSIQSLSDRLFDASYCLIESIDFSKCTMLTQIKGLSFAGKLTTVKLPEGLKELYWLSGPVREINLPSSLKYINGEGWFVRELTIPASMEDLTLYSLPFVTKIDASEAKSMYRFNGLNNCPMLRELDLSSSPVTNMNVFNGEDIAEYLGNETRAGNRQQRVVATGGTRYPAPKISGIETIIFPSTLKELSGIINCPNLKKIDLMACFRMEYIREINNCGNLASLALPESNLTIQGLKECPALTEITCAGATPPRYSSYSTDKFDFSNTVLTVGTGCAGAYRMAEGWSECKEIKESGHRVSIDYSSCYGTIKDPAAVNMYGAGLYPDGAKATLYAPTSGIYSCSAWTVNGERIEGNPLEITVNDNISASPCFFVDMANCDFLMTFDLTDPYQFNIELASSAHQIILNGEVVNTLKGNNYWDIRKYSLNMKAGENTLGINSDLVSIGFDYNSKNEFIGKFRVTDMKVNKPQSLFSLNMLNFDMDSLSLAGCSKLWSLNNYGNSKIRYLDVSDCAELEDLSVYDCGIENLIIGDSPIKQLYLSNNTISDLDVSGMKNLRILDISNCGMENLTLGETNLTKLYAINNKLKALDVSRLPALVEIQASNNELEEIMLGDVPVSTLVLSSNKLTSLDISGLDSLQYLDASNCLLEDVKLGESPVFTIELENNNLTVLDLSPLRGSQDLTRINVTNNRLTSLDLSGFDKMIAVEALDNELTEFKMSSDECTWLRLGKNPMGFSTLTPNMYDTYMRMRGAGNYVFNIDYKVYPQVIDETGTIDLSAELYPVGKDTMTTIRINDKVQDDSSTGGVFNLPYGYCYILMMNDAYPNLSYDAYFENKYSSVSSILSESFSFSIGEGKVVLHNVPQGGHAMLTAVDGKTADRVVFSADGDALLTASASGLHILTISNAAGETISFKINIP